MLETRSKSSVLKQSVGRMVMLLSLMLSKICVLSVAAVVFEWWERKEDCCSIPKEGSGGRAPGVHLCPRRHAVGRTPVASCAFSAARCGNKSMGRLPRARPPRRSTVRTDGGGSTRKRGRTVGNGERDGVANEGL